VHLPPGVEYMPKPWQPPNLRIVAERARSAVRSGQRPLVAVCSASNYSDCPSSAPVQDLKEYRNARIMGRKTCT
jgi:hypothetical protein